MKLSLSLIEQISENNELFNISFVCPDCAGIGDEQYTCTTCWGQGGDVEISGSRLLEIAIDYKKGQGAGSDYSENFILELAKNSNDAISIEKYDYPSIPAQDFDSVCEHDEDCSSSYIYVSDIFQFLLQ